jgi:hypothetical protein
VWCGVACGVVWRGVWGVVWCDVVCGVVCDITTALHILMRSLHDMYEMNAYKADHIYLRMIEIENRAGCILMKCGWTVCYHYLTWATQ